MSTKVSGSSMPHKKNYLSRKSGLNIIEEEKVSNLLTDVFQPSSYVNTLGNVLNNPSIQHHQIHLDLDLMQNHFYQ